MTKRDSTPDSEAPASEMPLPGSFDSHVDTGDMPTPSMMDATQDDDMPRPGRGQRSMKTTGEPGDSAVPSMAPPTTMAGNGQRPGQPRFGPPGGTAAAHPSYRPGVVEVQFREGVSPQIGPADAETPSIRSADEGRLDEMNQILRRHGLLQAEPTFLTSPDEASAAQAVARQQGIDAPHLGHFMTLHFPDHTDTRAIAAQLAALPEVERAVPVPVALPPTVTAETSMTGALTAPPVATPLTEPLIGNSGQVVVDPNTGLENQWYLFRCGVNNAWARSTAKDVVVADIDWGYRTSHQDLAGKVERTYNAFDGTTDVTHGPSIFHGTGVLGHTGAAVNDAGMAGVGFEAPLWAIQSDSGTGASLGGEPWARGIDWVRTTDSGGRRKVVILEVQTGAFGNYEQVPSVNAAIRTAIAAGVVVCVAAGNGDRDAGVDDSGNAIPETGSILVGATAYHDTENKRAWFSNYGPRIVVAAPGDGDHDLTCDSASDQAYSNSFGGTSGATPKVAGVAALMLAANPGLSPAEIRRILNVTGTPLTEDPGKPVGTFLDAGAAVRQAAAGAVSRLEVFARGADKALWHRWQTAPNNGWSGWESLGGWIDRLAVGRNGDGRIEAFARGADSAVWHTWQTSPGGSWSGWESLGGWIDLIDIGHNADGRLEIFARGADKALWHNWQTTAGGWSGWQSLGGWIDRLTVERNEDGRLEVFARGADGAVWHNWQTSPGGSWSGWQSLGGWIDLIDIGHNADGRLEIFARGADKALWHNWQTTAGGWSGWQSLGGWIDRLAVGRNEDGRIEAFARGADGAVWHTWQASANGSWSGWQSRGGWIDQLKVSQNNDGRIEVFGRGADGAVWHTWQTAPNNGWSGWASLGGWIDLMDIGQNAL